MESFREDESKKYMPETSANLFGYIKNTHDLQDIYNTLEEDHKNIEKELNIMFDKYNNIAEEYESHRENYIEKKKRLKIIMKEYFDNEHSNIEEIDKLIKKKEEESKIMECLKMKEDMILKTLKNTIKKKRKISEIMIEKEKELDKFTDKIFKLSDQLDYRGQAQGQCRDISEEF